MPKVMSLPVEQLCLDLYNYRTVPQPNEIKAIQAMISISPDYFWGLMDSLLTDGYLPTESIIVLNTGKAFIVKEGNRRVGILKILLGLLPVTDFSFPNDLADRVSSISEDWKSQNKTVPCTVFDPSEHAIVDRIVARAHGKGERAGKDKWNAVARARHNRDASKKSEPALDLLEKYLQHGRNITEQQKERWAGDYPLTVLDEAIKSVARRFEVKNASELAKKYPLIKHREALEEILVRIGRGEIGFPQIRDKSTDFAELCGLPPLVATDAQGDGIQSGDAASRTTADQAASTLTREASAKAYSASGGTSGQPSRGKEKSREPKATPITDPRTIKRLLRLLKFPGVQRAKLVSLRGEAAALDLFKNPIAFCFLLRSLLELSAKLYLDDNGVAYRDNKGRDKTLAEMLRLATDHLVNKHGKPMEKTLHGAMVELDKPNGILSVTSLNQLVHNPMFTISPTDICTTFGNIYPLLHAMNE